ncbi:mis12-mtw1 family protein [Niveomyces insectorum RCEF 264]|uniref:Mis12-mtw1 family protein n=1 Tax=Niveomyces insectorum RCEF 264 TaxID=1081102 RepID=A0A168AF82_9HYPO|nr:mis12-mtw1 family protein [Niveomyces insectorum RCEF 264]
MTTLVRTRLPLQDLSMSNQPERRHSKRLAATAVYDEQDGDFHFTRGVKRVKTVEPAPERVETAKKSASTQRAASKPSAGRKRASPIAATTAHRDDAPSPAALPVASSSRRPGRPKANAAATAASRPTPPRLRTTAAAAATGVAADEETPEPRAAPAPRRRARTSVERSDSERPDSTAASSQPPAIAPARVVGRGRRSRGSGGGTGTGGTTQRQRRQLQQQQQQHLQPASDADGNDDDDDENDVAVVDDEDPASPGPQQIALPFTDTPIINRNKELRRKGGQRRSSVGMRGRRASSLIENGHSALPHREVDAAEFYKHIEADGLTEPRRMRQLLMWCGERALSEKPPHGSSNASAVLGARAIQDQLLKDFANRPEFSDWFGRDELPEDATKRAKEPQKPERPVVLKPNPRNIEHEEKIVELEARVKRLKEEKKRWMALAKPAPDLPPLYAEGEDPVRAPSVPDETLLDPEEVAILHAIVPPKAKPTATPSTGTPQFVSRDDPHAKPIPPATFRAQVLERLQRLCSTVPFTVDHLAHNVHVLDQRVAVAGQEADLLLRRGAARLKEREDREKEAVGTKELPVMEVLRSLSRILPDEGSSGGGPG